MSKSANAIPQTVSQTTREVCFQNKGGHLPAIIAGKHSGVSSTPGLFWRGAGHGAVPRAGHPPHPRPLLFSPCGRPILRPPQPPAGRKLVPAERRPALGRVWSRLHVDAGQAGSGGYGTANGCGPSFGGWSVQRGQGSLHIKQCQQEGTQPPPSTSVGHPSP